MNIEEVEEPDFKTIAEHRKVQELPRKMNIEEVEEPETTKITRQNLSTPIPAKPKARQLPRKMHIQERKYEKYHESRPQPPI